MASGLTNAGAIVRFPDGSGSNESPLTGIGYTPVWQPAPAPVLNGSRHTSPSGNTRMRRLSTNRCTASVAFSIMIRKRCSSWGVKD